MSFKRLTVSQHCFLAAVAALSGCIRHEAPATVKSEVPAVVNQYVQPLGTGYLALIDEFFQDQTCVTSSKRENDRPVFLAAYAPQAVLAAGRSESEDLSEHRLRSGAEVHGGISLGIAKFSIDGRVEIETALVEHDLKTSVYTTFTNQAGNLVLIDPELTPTGKRVAGGTDLIAKVERLFACGDEFVYQIQLGNRLYVGLEYAFASKEVKNNFNLKVDGSAKVARKKISKTFLRVNENFNLEAIQGSVRIIFEQEGGDLAAFNAYKQTLPTDCFVQGEVVHEGSGAKVGVLKGFDQCVEAYKRLMREYALQQFPAQVKGLEAAARTDPVSAGYTALRYYTMPYERAGYPEFKGFIKDLPPNLRAFLNDRLKPSILGVKKLLGGLAAVESIAGNTSGSPAMSAVKSQLAQLAPDGDVTRLVTTVQSLRGQAKLALTHCRKLIIEGLVTDYKAGGHQFPALAEKLQTCGASLDGLNAQVEQFNNLTGSN